MKATVQEVLQLLTDGVIVPESGESGTTAVPVARLQLPFRGASGTVSYELSPCHVFKSTLCAHSAGVSCAMFPCLASSCGLLLAACIRSS